MPAVRLSRPRFFGRAAPAVRRRRASTDTPASLTGTLARCPARGTEPLDDRHGHGADPLEAFMRT